MKALCIARRGVVVSGGGLSMAELGACCTRARARHGMAWQVCKQLGADAVVNYSDPKSLKEKVVSAPTPSARAPEHLGGS